MHPIIAFLSFIFSPASDWALQRGFHLVMNPYDVPAIVESYADFQKNYPSKNPENSNFISADPKTMATWAEILDNHGYSVSASEVRRKLLKKGDLEPDLSDDLKIRLGESALQAGVTEDAEKYFNDVASRGGPRTLDAKVNLLISALAEKDLDLAKTRGQELGGILGSDISYKRAQLPMGLLAYADENYNEAIHHLSQMEDDPRALYFIGLAHRHEERPQEALTAWSTLTKDVESTWAGLAEFQVAETYFHLGDENLSRRTCEKALAKNPEGDIKNKFIFRLASMDIKDGDFDSALARLEEIPETDILTDRALVLSAESMVQTEKSSDLVKRLAKRPDKDSDVETLYQKAWASLFDKKTERALEVSETALNDFYHETLTPRLLLLQGLAFEHQGQTAEALATYQVITDRFHNTLAASKAIHWSLLSYMRLGRTREAVTHTAHLWARQSSEMRAAYPAPSFWLGEAHNRLKRFEDADQHLGEFLSKAELKDELIPYGQFQRSYALAKQKKTEAALALLDEFAQTSTDQGKPEWTQLAHLQKGHIHFNTKNYETAIAHYREAGQNPKALFYEGVALARLDYYSDAIKTWTVLASSHPDSSYSEKGLFRAGRTEFELGWSTKAVATFAQFVETYPNSPQVKDALLQSAHALYNAGESERAAALYTEFLNQEPTTLEIAAVAPFLASAHVQAGKNANEIEDLMRGLPPTETLASLTWEEGAKNYNAKEYKEAANKFGGLLAANPATEHSGNAMFYRGESYFLTNQWSHAENAYNNYIKSIEQSQQEHGPLAMFRKSVSIFNQSRLFEAAESFEEMVQTYPEETLTTEAKQNMLLCYYNIGAWDRMEEARTKYNIQAPAQTTTEDSVSKRRVYEVGPYEVRHKQNKEADVALSEAEDEQTNLDVQ